MVQACELRHVEQGRSFWQPGPGRSKTRAASLQFEQSIKKNNKKSGLSHRTLDKYLPTSSRLLSFTAKT
jgi:hypothetical protein